MAIRIEVTTSGTAAAVAILQGAAALNLPQITGCRIVHLYFISEELDDDQIQTLCSHLLVDPVTASARWRSLSADPEPEQESVHVVEVTYRPGVTDVTARELARGIEEIGLPPCQVATATRYELTGHLSEAQLRQLAQQLLCNETVQHFTLGPITPQFGEGAVASDRVEVVPLAQLDRAQLAALSKVRLLSLDANEMAVIQEFYDELGRDPTDVELETLAQTWSEHCVHKTFRARIDYLQTDATGAPVANEVVDGLLRQYIRAATEQINSPWLRSAFVDNAGIIAFDDSHDLAFKVETHNHPSALEPFGGANTGVGGVVRDIIGVSARPIAISDVLCFGPQDYPHSELPDGILHPHRIATGVVDGIADYGNKLGLPTVNGAVLYDAGYLGNPLIFCGCVGILPSGSHPTNPQQGDLVVVLGGRTGRDGLHGATFSSAELTHETSETSGSAVQIGDPITEKGLIELIEAARDERLYTGITDCGAGGLSSAVGEMGKELGVDIELTHVALKYPGLVPWEIWLSEAQERMVLAVPPGQLGRLRELAQLWDVELSVLGTFTGKGELLVRYAGRPVAQLPMAFLHEGLPQRHMQAHWQPPAPLRDADHPEQWNVIDPATTLFTMLAHPNVASKEAIVRRYDHEVRGGTIVRPFIGPLLDGPSDAAVLKPLGTWRHNKAFALSAGINPFIGQLDPYAMAISAIDEAFRNLVAVGGDPDRVAILDNFCWGNPTLPDRLGALVRACQGCYDGALAYSAPFISGKDSLYNEFNGNPIPSTLLISAIAIVPDFHATCTSDLKQPGNRLYLLGETLPEFGGSLLSQVQARNGAGTPPSLPSEPLHRYRRLHQAMQQGWIQACHDLSEGGLAVALAEMAIGGRLGAEVTLSTGATSATTQLFAESNGRLLLEVRAEDASQVEQHFGAELLHFLGVVSAKPVLQIRQADVSLVDLPVEQLLAAWQPQRAAVAGA